MVGERDLWPLPQQTKCLGFMFPRDMLWNGVEIRAPDLGLDPEGERVQVAKQAL